MNVVTWTELLGILLENTWFSAKGVPVEEIGRIYGKIAIYLHEFVEYICLDSNYLPTHLKHIYTIY